MPKVKPPDSDQLYTRQDYEALRMHRARLGNLLTRLDKMRACGMACDFLEQQRKETDEQLAAIEQHFMTPAPGK